ncbi:MAG: hypothetical protein ACLTSG_11935 [Lachnospiraceae bacterium]
MGVLAQLEPKEVFSYFETICGIPHGSGNTGPIADYLVQFAKDNGLEWYRDAANNVVLTKPASPGYEAADTIILQAHTDMVCEKAPGVEFDFTKDAIRPIIEDDVIRADGTTLGADDGISVAMILALLSDKEKPPEARGAADLGRRDRPHRRICLRLLSRDRPQAHKSRLGVRGSADVQLRWRRERLLHHSR